MSGGMIFVIVLVAIMTVGRIVREGMKLEGRKAGRGGDTIIARLEADNAMLRGKLDRLENRTAVLERIATDAPARLAAQIDNL